MGITIQNYEQALSDLPGLCQSIGGQMTGTSKCTRQDGTVMEIAPGAVYFTFSNASPSDVAALLSGECQQAGGTVAGNTCQIGSGSDALVLSVEGNRVKMAKAGAGGGASAIVMLGLLGLAAYLFLK